MMKPHEDWWQRNLPDPQKMDSEKSGVTFRHWIKDTNAESRKAFRNLIKQNAYKSMLDCACGLCIEYHGLIKSAIDIKYSAIDITQKLVEYNLAKGIDIKQGSIEKIPHADNSFELCYGRHILEHLDQYQKALEEMIRVATHAVIITFFKPPAETEIIDYMPDERLYHNVYNRSEMQNFINDNKKVSSIQWIKPPTKEEILHIRLT